MRNILPPLLITTSLVTLPAAAYEWAFNPVIADYSCIVDCADYRATRDAQLEGLRRAYDKVEPELDAILEWMDGLGFTRPFFPANGPNGTSNVTLVDLSQSGSRILRGQWDSIYAYYAPDEGMAINALEIPTYTNPEGAGAGLDPEVRDTLAHETYHAVQEAVGSIEGADWVVEGTAELAGNAYVGRGPQRSYSYALPLEDPATEYDRSHFFHALGADFGTASSPAAYLARFEEAYDADGLIWVDTFLRNEGQSLAEYFPNFIARNVSNRDEFRHLDMGMGWIEGELPRPEVIADTNGERDTSRRFEIDRNAAAAMEFTPVFQGDFSGLDDSARIYVNRITLEEGSDPVALSLVVGSEVVGAEPFFEPVFASAGEMDDPFNVRVVNVSERPTDSALNSAIMALSTTRVTFGLPACISSDDRIGIIESASLSRDEIIDAFNVDGASLNVRGGGSLSDDLYYSAAGASGRVEIVATLPTLDGGSTTVTVADTIVRPDGCMIQMRIGDAYITWDANRQYTEFAQAGGGEALYMRNDDFAAFFEGGFQPLPAMARDMMMNAFRGRFAGGSLDGLVSGLDAMPDMRGVDWLPTTPGVDIDGAALAQLVDDFPMVLTDGLSEGLEGGWGMHQMPQDFVDRFSWRNLRRLEDRSRRARAACPAFADASDAPCSSITLTRDGIQGTVVYSDSGWPLTVTMAGQTIEFEADYFPIRRPPGW